MRILQHTLIYKQSVAYVMAGVIIFTSNPPLPAAQITSSIRIQCGPFETSHRFGEQAVLAALAHFSGGMPNKNIKDRLFDMGADFLRPLEARAQQFIADWLDDRSAPVFEELKRLPMNEFDTVLEIVKAESLKGRPILDRMKLNHLLVSVIRTAQSRDLTYRAPAELEHLPNFASRDLNTRLTHFHASLLQREISFSPISLNAFFQMVASETNRYKSMRLMGHGITLSLYYWNPFRNSQRYQYSISNAIGETLGHGYILWNPKTPEEIELRFQIYSEYRGQGHAHSMMQVLGEGLARGNVIHRQPIHSVLWSYRNRDTDFLPTLRRLGFQGDNPENMRLSTSVYATDTAVSRRGFWKLALPFVFGALSPRRVRAEVRVDPQLDPRIRIVLDAVVPVMGQLFRWPLQTDDPDILDFRTSADIVFLGSDIQVQVGIGDIRDATDNSVRKEIFDRSSAPAVSENLGNGEFRILFDRRVMREGVAALTLGVALEAVALPLAIERSRGSFFLTQRDVFIEAYRLEIKYMEMLLQDPAFIKQFPNQFAQVLVDTRRLLENDKAVLAYLEQENFRTKLWYSGAVILGTAVGLFIRFWRNRNNRKGPGTPPSAGSPLSPRSSRPSGTHTGRRPFLASA